MSTETTETTMSERAKRALLVREQALQEQIQRLNWVQVGLRQDKDLVARELGEQLMARLESLLVDVQQQLHDAHGVELPDGP